jgi:probable phosphoglycerate mutase
MPLDRSTRILAIRHGETAWNLQARIQGHRDIPLNGQGQAQARRLTSALAGEAIDAIYCSDLLRARQTAAGVATATGLAVQLDAGLRERSFGIFEGLTWSEIALGWPAQSERWRARDASFGAEGGETLTDFYARSLACLERLAQAHPGQTVVVVTHGGVLDCLHRASRRMSLQAAKTWALGNAAINRVLYSAQGFSLIGWNDDSHLHGIGPDEAAECSDPQA